MNYNDGHETVAIRKWHHAFTMVKYGVDTVWQAVRSCFGRGIWIPSKPWLGSDKWKNN